MIHINVKLNDTEPRSCAGSFQRCCLGSLVMCMNCRLYERAYFRVPRRPAIVSLFLFPSKKEVSCDFYVEAPSV